MSFSEKIKLEVKKMAMFRCCRCQEVGVDVHHVLPKKNSGSDNIKNAAPLCQNCHDQFGDNPSKRKEITQMRNHWYGVVKKMYSPKLSNIYPLIKKLDEGLEDIKKDRSSTQKDMNEVKSTLKKISDSAIDNMTLGTVSLVASNMVNASGASLSNIRSEYILSMKHCKKCGTGYWPANTFDNCLSCDGELSS